MMVITREMKGRNNTKPFREKKHFNAAILLCLQLQTVENLQGNPVHAMKTSSRRMMGDRILIIRRQTLLQLL